MTRQDGKHSATPDNALHQFQPRDEPGSDRRDALKHRSMDMTLRYAKIASRTVADEYFAVTDKVDALYGQAPVLPADAIGPKMARLRREHHRLLGNGWCTRPPELDCAFESICETCTFFQTSIAFRPTLQAQHDHAITHHQDHRGQLFASLLARIDQDAS